jgi:branched-chain amino acid transport system substrate-binding protein
MEKKGMTRRDFMKVGFLTGAAVALGPGVLKPVGVWAATPAVKGPVKVGYQAVLSGALAG